MYSVLYTRRALKFLKKLDKTEAALILGWVERHLVDCEDPFRTGKALQGNHGGEWRYRVGDYRLLALIDQKSITILLIDIGHRKDI